MRVDPVTRYADYGGKSIAYQQFGDGEKRLLQVNAMPGHLELIWLDPAFTDALERFAEASEVILFEQLGLGMSDPVDHLPTIEEQAEEIGAVMDAAGWESATICGVFSTCLAASVFAAHHPDRVDGLSLLAPFAQGLRSAPPSELVGWESAQQVEKADREMSEAIAAWGSGRSLASYTPDLANPRAVRRWGVLERASASPQMARAIYDVSVNADIRDALRAVQAPSLVLRPPATFFRRQWPAMSKNYCQTHASSSFLPHRTSRSTSAPTSEPSRSSCWARPRSATRPVP